MRYSTNDLATETVPGVPPPEDTPAEETIDPQKPDLTCTADKTKMKDYGQVVGMENVWGNAYSKETSLYNKYRKYSKWLNPWHPFQSAHNFQQAQPLS